MGGRSGIDYGQFTGGATVHILGPELFSADS